MSIYINDTKTKTVRHYYRTTPKIEKAIETLLQELDDLGWSETHKGYQVEIKEIEPKSKKETK